MGLKSRIPEHNAGLAELLQEEHREKEGVVSSGHEKLDSLSAVAYVLDEPDVAALTAPSGHDVEFEAVAAKIEARLAAAGAMPLEEEGKEVAPSPAPPAMEDQPTILPSPPPPLPPPSPPLEAPTGTEGGSQGGEPCQGAGPSTEEKLPKVVGPPPSGRLGPKDVAMLEVRGSCENSDGSLLSRQVVLDLFDYIYKRYIHLGIYNI